MAPLNMARLMAGGAVRQTAFPASFCLQRLHQSSLLRMPRKDSQDKDSINTDATEYSKSGTDDDAARNEQAAFAPSQTAPGEQKEKAGEGNKVRLAYDELEAVESMEFDTDAIGSRLIPWKYRRPTQTCQSRGLSRKEVHQIPRRRVLVRSGNRVDMARPTKERRSEM
jgi:hypothetical protein